MTQAVLFDLGNTLLDEQTNRPLPGATELLDARRRSRRAWPARPLRSGVGLEDAAEPVGGGAVDRSISRAASGLDAFSDRWRRE